jgi:RHS repeat-associated protein
VYNFTGQRLDAQTGLLYYHARYYDAVSGNFLSADSVEGNQQGLSPYGYVNGNPETHVDPSGQSDDPILWVWINILVNLPGLLNSFIPGQYGSASNQSIVQQSTSTQNVQSDTPFDSPAPNSLANGDPKNGPWNNNDENGDNGSSGKGTGGNNNDNGNPTNSPKPNNGTGGKPRPKHNGPGGNQWHFQKSNLLARLLELNQPDSLGLSASVSQPFSQPVAPVQTPSQGPSFWPQLTPQGVWNFFQGVGNFVRGVGQDIGDFFGQSSPGPEITPNCACLWDDPFEEEPFGDF